MKDESIISLFTEWMVDNNYLKIGVDKKGEYLWCPDGNKGHVAKTTEQLFDFYKRGFHPPHDSQQTDEEAVIWKEIKIEDTGKAVKGWVPATLHYHHEDKEVLLAVVEPQHPQQQAGREAIRENIENALESTGQFYLSQCEELAEIAMGCIPVSSVSNQLTIQEAVTAMKWLINTLDYYNENKLGQLPIIEDQLPLAREAMENLRALFTSQPGERTYTAQEVVAMSKQSLVDTYNQRAGEDQLFDSETFLSNLKKKLEG